MPFLKVLIVNSSQFFLKNDYKYFAGCENHDDEDITSLLVKLLKSIR